ncbi:RB1-inducible coiled-coil protein 1 [Hypsibius exemplaris]|uniref:RB1-inducible coiled-coil protein 1 n=1 Tax=Hypsibius exemplaris TaxID=2072580 RepID=A0A1W0WZ41_HYPEX|nr:RB1-inducible coiled-coil protein 1 [Hypsibius exemplaris]
MLYIFWVEKGSIITLHVDVAVDTVNNLKIKLAQSTGISEVSQVLLINGGESLRDGSRVAKYQSGTDTNPIFLFNRDAIESDRVPDVSADSASSVPDEWEAKESVEAVTNLPPNFNSIVSRTQLAQQYHDFARELNKQCSLLVQEQHLQHQGWQAVMANLDDVISAFKKRLEKFQATFESYLTGRNDKLQHLMSFNEDLEILSKLPLFPSLIRVSQIGPASVAQSETRPAVTVTGQEGHVEGHVEGDLKSDSTEETTILDWISAKDSDHNLQSVAEGCRRTMDTFDEATLEDVMKESRSVMDFCNNAQMREIKGLAERLFGLDQLLSEAKKQVLEQKETADVLYKMQQQASASREPQMFKDLAVNFSQLLQQMLKCHKKLCDIKRRCLAAKQELCSHLHVRLKWVITVENSITEVDDKIKIYYENIKRIKRLTHMLDQVRDCPRVYVAAVEEVLRRRHYSKDFLSWAETVSRTATRACTDETELRRSFLSLHGSHFLLTLFPGLDQFPPQFAATPPEVFDSFLPPLTEDDLKSLLDRIPDSLSLTHQTLDGKIMLPCPFTCQSGQQGPSTSTPPDKLDSKLQRRVSFHGDYDIVAQTAAEPPAVLPHCTPVERELLDRLPALVTSTQLLCTVLRACHLKLQQDFTTMVEIMRELVERLRRESSQQALAKFAELESGFEEKLKQKEDAYQTVLFRSNNLADQLQERDRTVEELQRRLEAESVAYRLCQEQLDASQQALRKRELELEDLKTHSEEVSGQKDREIAELRVQLCAAIEEGNRRLQESAAEHADRQAQKEQAFSTRLACEKDALRADLELAHEIHLQQQLTQQNLARQAEFDAVLAATVQEKDSAAERQMSELRSSLESGLVHQTEQVFISRLAAEKDLLRTELEQAHESRLQDQLTQHNLARQSEFDALLAATVDEKDAETERKLDELRSALEAANYQKELMQVDLDRKSSCSASSPPPPYSDAPRRVAISDVAALAADVAADVAGSMSVSMTQSYMVTQPPSDPLPVSPRPRNLSTGPDMSITLSSCNVGDLVLFVYNKEFKQYTAYLPFKRSLYLLHSDSHVELSIAVPEHDGALVDVRSWVVGQIVGKEYVITRKVPNRYRLQVGARFYRIKAKSWDLESILKEAATATAGRSAESNLSTSTVSGEGGASTSSSGI